MTEAENFIPLPFERLKSILAKFEPSEDRTPSLDRRSKTLSDGNTLAITRVETSANKSIGVLFQGFYFSIGEEGLKHISFPEVSIDFDGELQTIPPLTFAEFKTNPQKKAQILVNWLENSIKNNTAEANPFGISFSRK